ncbi:DUF1351 domain-containing protein [Lacticaseibacillus baoqingensis]|uniref:DUF1351 domain-containing protein n=1 Tax=Lacticaseibacillus baoqingensis TaxID=2486013 RepID=A0ABW4E639_9LACO|nr:DUF1351 domain-containing protein [Lacticaseibacillus baoqingensis]
MTNDLMVPEDLTYKVDYVPAKIDFLYFDEMKSNVLGYTDRFKNIVVSPETVDDAKKVKANLNKLKKQVDERRKEIHRGYEAPYKDFEVKVKEITSIIDAAIVPIDGAVKELDAIEQSKRESLLITYITDLAPNYGLNIDDYEIKPSWSNKSMWTKSNKPNAQLMREIGQMGLDINTHRERIASDKSAVEAYATANGLDASGWVAQIDQGATFAQLRGRIDDELMRRKKEADAAKKRAEAQAAIDAMHQQQTAQGTVDIDTGELTAPVAPQPAPQVEQQTIQQATAQPTDSHVYRQAFWVEGTKEQLWWLANQMNANGIKYQGIKKGEY